MNPARLILAIIAGFIYIFASDYVIHAIWLDADYKASASLWRTEFGMRSRLPLMLGAQLLCALAFMYIWAKTGWRRRSLADGAVFGLWLGVFQQVMTIVLYVVIPLPNALALKWFFVGILQTVLLGVLAAAVYKPRSVLSDRPA